MKKSLMLAVILITSAISDFAHADPLAGCYVIGVRGALVLKERIFEIQNIGNGRYKAFLNGVEFKLKDSEFKNDYCRLTFGRPTAEEDVDEVVKLNFVDGTGKCTEVPRPGRSAIPTSYIEYGFKGTTASGMRRVGLSNLTLFYEPARSCRE